jgi:hypothetical protein
LNRIHLPVVLACLLMIAITFWPAGNETATIDKSRQTAMFAEITDMIDRIEANNRLKEAYTREIASNLKEPAR